MSQSERNSNKKSFKEIIYDVFVSFMANALTAVITFVITLVCTLALLPSKLTDINNQLSEITDKIGDTDFDELDKAVSALAGNENNINVINKLDDLEKQLADILKKTDKIDDLEAKLVALEESNNETGLTNNGIIYGDITISPTKEFQQDIDRMDESVEKEDFAPKSLVLFDENKEETVATDLRTGEEYAKGQLSNQNLSASYIDGEKEVFFNGQYDENGYWDGDCVINVYENRNLVSVKDVKYKNGEILSYEQVFLNKEKSNWFVTKRKHEEEYNSGETWKFIYEDSYEQAFESQKFSAENLIHVKDFESIMNLKLEGYYCGNTKDGLYNDDGGDAYLIKFFDNGTVRTLYVGKFSDGWFFDETGESWYITKEDDTDYMYYKGDFKDRHPANITEGHFENGITQERINEIIEGKTFTYELKWDITEDI